MRFHDYDRVAIVTGADSGVLVNCAGTGISTPVVETGYDQWREVLAVDLDGPFLCARRAGPATPTRWPR